MNKKLTKMKKVILFFSVMFLSVTLSFGQLTTTVSIPDMGGGLPAGSVFTPVTMDAIGGGENWGTLQFYFFYDPLVLTPVSVVFTNPTMPFYEWMNNLTYGPDEIILTWLSFSGGIFPAPGEELCQIEWTYTGDPDFSSLVWGLEVKDPIPGWPEKGLSAIWSTAGTIYDATFVDGSVGPIATPGLWTGVTSSDWFDGTNWDDGMVPSGIDVTIPAGTPNDPVIETNDATPTVAWTLDLTSDAPIVVNPLGYLSVDGVFTNDGGLTVLSDDTYNGSFIYGAALGGDFQYDRYVASWPSATGGWHYMSSPIAGFGSHNILDYFLNTWDETTSMFFQHVGGEPCVPAAEIFNDGMDGWSVKWDDAYACPAPGTGETVEFIGAPNFGDQIGGATASGVGAFPNFNLMGNPYPSYWDFQDYYDGINWTGNLNPTIYFWYEWGEQYATYNAFDFSSTNGGNGFVPPVQGFFLEANAADVVTFTDAERAHVYNVTYWKDASNMVKLMATANDRSDETVISFNENSTVNRDSYDSRKLISPVEYVPALYTMASDMTIAINHMPATESVPVYFEMGTSSSVTIEAIETGEFANVVLEDLLLGTQTSLLEGSYTFDHIAGADPDRFILHFTPLGIGDNFADYVNIWSSANNIYVQVPDVTGDIVVFNMMGQEVVRTDIEPGTTVIPMNDVNTYYVVKVLTSDNAVTGKVFIK